MASSSRQRTAAAVASRHHQTYNGIPAPNYAQDLEKCKRFLREYNPKTLAGQEASTSQDGAVRFRTKYMAQLQRIANREQHSLTIDMDDLAAFDDFGEHFVQVVQRNTHRYIDLFSQAADELMPEPTVEFGDAEDVIDVLRKQHQRQQELAAEHAEVPDSKKSIPPALFRRYDMYIKPSANLKPRPIRDIKAADIGSLVNVTGIVVRASDVKPLLRVQTYTCDKCHSEVFQEVSGQSYNPLVDCPAEPCKVNNTRGRLFPQTRGSKFIKMQELKVQENADQVPVGHIPRSITVTVYGDLTRRVGPGDSVVIGGIFLATPYSGFRAMRAGLLANVHIQAEHITKLKENYNEYKLTPEIVAKIDAIASDPGLFDKLSRSIAPEIYGHEDVKRALALMLVGAPKVESDDGMRIRGELNICLMGDPGVAKSQLLKYITKIAPRGIYTTGKGSSGVGLTAAVQKDPVTGDMTLEGGALVLADMGICCIDEFDKMDDSDKTAIHEVMEQQTVSICKAGITTTLNARTSVLAAANPIHGRYNVNRSPTENINLPPALLSRFDLLFLILDIANPDDDLKLCQHITYVHMHGTQPKLDFDPIDMTTMRHYIAKARTLNPVVPPALTEFIVDQYVSMRNETALLTGKSSAKNDSNRRGHYAYTTARTLLAILRLSLALARIRLSEEVSRADVDEAMRLMHMSKASIYKDDMKGEAQKDAPSSILEIIRGMVNDRKNDNLDTSLRYREVLDEIERQGFSKQQLQTTLDEAMQLNILMVTDEQIDLMTA
jgi:DNA replication licensing factor MCM7